MRQAIGYGIFAVLGIGATTACIADLGWGSLIVLGVVGALALACWLVEG